MLAAVIALVAGCDDPTLARRPPALDAMVVFMILDPDSATQPLLLYAADGSGPVPGVMGEISRSGSTVASEGAFQFSWPCADRYGPLGGAGVPACIDFDFKPDPGATYGVTVTGDGYPPVSAAVTVPGDFAIRGVVARGSPPGTDELDVTWTPSDGAHSYFVAVRPESVPPCTTVGACPSGWFAITTDTAFHGSVPAEDLEGSEGPWLVDVYAVDRAAFEYLTTGTSDNLFPVHPVQNVQGGYGAVGAWVRRSRVLP